MPSAIIEGLSNASGGFGRTIDVAEELGNGSTVIPKCVVVTESAAVGSGAAQLQSGVASASGITWSPVGASINLALQLQTLTSPGAPVAFIRVVIITPLSGGKCTAIVFA